MKRLPDILKVLSLTMFWAAGAFAQTSFIDIEHADKWEIVFEPSGEVHYVSGSVAFETETGMIYCDSAVWRKGRDVRLRGSVIIDDEEYYLVADSVVYSPSQKDATARGAYVELWAKADSLFATGTHVYFDRERSYYEMEDRPTVLLNYPDTANLIEVIADDVTYDGSDESAKARGNVKLSGKDMAAESGCAIFRRKRNLLDLYDAPIARKGESLISGELISILMSDEAVRQIDVIDSAHGDFKEPLKDDSTRFDLSILDGKRIIIDFVDGEIDRVRCWGQAYSWYVPAVDSGQDVTENEVSGDTITFTSVNERLDEIEVEGGAQGTYLTTDHSNVDSLGVAKVDTIHYRAENIQYRFSDSLITLSVASHVTSGDVSLDAHRINFETQNRIIKAYAATPPSDSAPGDPYSLNRVIQPKPIPVVLQDGEEELFGDYLEYSLDTEKGRILTSKTDYETGYYYGEQAFRANKDIFYVRDGRFTTCNANEPHFHFHSENMKLMEGDKLFARPVVLYLGRLPLMIVPYWVFSLQRGRHSGFLPFTFGNFERGERYIRNVGYYWAPSEYFDIQTAIDYLEQDRTFTLYNRLAYNKRYHFSGNVSVRYTRQTLYRRASQFGTEIDLGGEDTRTRWAVQASHNHEISPSFRITGSGEYLSDATYYTDLSADLEDRLNRNLVSRVNFQKRFGQRVTLSGVFSREENLDAESRTEVLPSASLSLPAWNPFGSGQLNEDGKLERKWFNEIVLTYRPRVDNFRNRITVDSTFFIETPVVDTIIDTTDVGGIITIDTTEITAIDSTAYTLSSRSRKEYTKAGHSVSVRAPFKLLEYFVFNPRLSYNETWFKIWETDQSIAAGINADQAYRTYSYSLGASMNTNLYGTVNPGIGPLVGLRQVITPTISYSYAPEVDRHPGIRSFAGGGAGNSRTSSAASLSFRHVYQAKVLQDDIEKVLELLSVSHSLSYDFENTERPYSNLLTTFQSSVLPRINISGNMVHSLYKPETNDIDLLSPYLEGFSLNAVAALSGSTFLFDDRTRSFKGADSASQVGGGSESGRGWNASLNYTFRQSGRGDFFSKRSFLSLTLNFDLTPTTAVSYSHSYDFERDNTVNSQVRITKNLHCWTGTFFWVPTGSNRGYGFRLYVTALPSIKIENSENPFSTSYLQGVGQ